MSDVRKLRWWCHKILPLVYDNSLSYYELLCKVVSKLNEVIENTNVDFNVYAEVKKIMDEWLEDGTIASLIPETDIPFSETLYPEYMYTYLREDPRYVIPGWGQDHPIQQSICVINNTEGVAVFSRATDNDNTVLLQKFNLETGALIGNGTVVHGGHGNDICYDGEYLYVVWYYDYTGGTTARTNKITKLTTGFETVGIINLGIGSAVDAMTYDRTTQRFIALYGQTIYFLDKSLTNVVNSAHLEIDYYKSFYGSASRFLGDTIDCNNGYIYIPYSFPSTVFAFDYEGAVKRIYNVPSVTSNGAPMVELEAIAFNPYNDFGYLTSFSRIGHGDFAVNTLCRFNLKTGSINKQSMATSRLNYYYAASRVYVDGTLPYEGKMLGTQAFPFRCLQQAFDYMWLDMFEGSIIVMHTDVIENIGTVNISGFSNLNVRTDDTSNNDNNDNMFIPRMTIARGSNVDFFYMNIGELSVNETVSVDFGRCKIGESSFDRAEITELDYNTIGELSGTRSSFVNRSTSTITTPSFTSCWDVGTPIT